MSKHIKRFSTYDDYLDYITDSSFEPPLVSVCDEMSDPGEIPPTMFVSRNDIRISNPGGYYGTIYVTDEHEVLYTYYFGPVLRASNDSHILGESIDGIDSIPYHSGLYYCWKVQSLTGYNVSTVYYYNSEGHEYEGEISTDGIIDTFDFWNNYCDDNSLNTYDSPYSITGFPGTYNYPTITVYAGENSMSDDYEFYNINEGDEIQLPLAYGYKLLPGSILTISRPVPE